MQSKKTVGNSRSSGLRAPIQVAMTTQSYEKIHFLQEAGDENLCVFKAYPCNATGDRGVIQQKAANEQKAFLRRDPEGVWKFVRVKRASEGEEATNIIDPTVIDYLNKLAEDNLEKPFFNVTDDAITGTIMKDHKYVQPQVERDMHRTPCLLGEREQLHKLWQRFSKPFTQGDFMGGSGAQTIFQGAVNAAVSKEYDPTSLKTLEEDGINGETLSLSQKAISIVGLHSNKQGAFGLTFSYSTADSGNYCIR